MIPGEVVFRKNHKFADGGNADKLFVVVNIQRDNKHLVFKTTSRHHEIYRPRKEGCQQQHGYFHIPKGKAWFNVETWIVLNDPQVMEASGLDADATKGEVKIMARLTDELIRAIINCFMKTDDFAPIHKWLLG